MMKWPSDFSLGQFIYPQRVTPRHAVASVICWCWPMVTVTDETRDESKGAGPRRPNKYRLFAMAHKSRTPDRRDPSDQISLSHWRCSK